MKSRTVFRIACAWTAFSCLYLSNLAQGDVRLPRIFSAHMVLQREVEVPIWGWADPGEEVTVSIGDQTQRATANEEGKWQVVLQPLKVGPPRTLRVEGNNRLEIEDVLVGEVWLCSGQSNMQWPVDASRDTDLTRASAGNALIRLLTIEGVGTQEPQEDIESQWEVATPETVGSFSAVGYHFGKRLQETLQVPVGLIDNSWGGSACEAWIPVDKMQAEIYEPIFERWQQEQQKQDEQEIRADFAQQMDEWRQQRDAALAQDQAIPAAPSSRHPLLGQHRPANIYNARILPIAPFAVRGVIWYQGESNASRAYQYREMFPLMIQTWRELWQRPELPFYWVQLADFKQEHAEPTESDWAELREAQTMTMDRLPHTGQAVIIDLGEAKDIHPRNKRDVANRLARWALARQYCFEVAYASPRFDSLEVRDGKVRVKFKNVGGGLTAFDSTEVEGFAVAGEDRQWQSAQAEIVDKQTVVVWSDRVQKPVAVRYAWADNPVCNLFSAEWLPATPLRSDDWPGVTADAR